VDIKTIFTTLDFHRVVYVLVGTLGAIAHGAILQTSDVDICNAVDACNLQRIAAALRDLHASLLREPPGRAITSIDLEDWRTLRLDDPLEHHLFGTPYGEIDILPEPLGATGWGSATNYEQLRPQAVTVRAFGLAIQVAAFDYIASSKLAIRRPQDIAAEAELRRVGQLLARGEDTSYGLEAFAAHMIEAPENHIVE
jgi:hypothetical protein